jgi:isochorismate synthase
VALLAQQITLALDAARAAGQTNPLLIGAFAFDPAEASCLYVPGHYERGEKLAPTEPTPATEVEQAVEANRVISVQSTPPASEFQASVSAALDALHKAGSPRWCCRANSPLPCTSPPTLRR